MNIQDLLVAIEQTAQDEDVYTVRKKKLQALLDQTYQEKGIFFLCAPHAYGSSKFEQESSFFYMTGLKEPSLAFMMQDNVFTLFIPKFGKQRLTWVQPHNQLHPNQAEEYGLDAIEWAGQDISGYSVPAYPPIDYYEKVIAYLKDCVAQGLKVYTLYPPSPGLHVQQKQMVDWYKNHVPGLSEAIVDVSSLIGQLRRNKDMHEIETLYEACAITAGAFEAATRIVQSGKNEAEVQAALEYIFIENQATKAYAPIVGGGKRSTILHYEQNNQELISGDVVLIDAGARYQYYCSDVTRVYPVSGSFTKRQREIYEIVLAAQEHVVQHIRPGVWLSNKNEPELSLHHIALDFLQQCGYADYFSHGIGHFLGLDVHDVGNIQDPLQAGDVITIEPGVYIADENIGIRIEDNYWVVQDADPVCLTESIPKEIEAIEREVAQSF